MKKKLITMLSAMVLFFASFGLAACDFNDFKPLLATPEITLDSQQKVVTWQEVKNAERYHIYVNGKYIETIDAVSGLNSYNLSNVDLSTEDAYEIFVMAIADGYNPSGISNVQIYTLHSNNWENDHDVSNSYLNQIKNLKIENNVLTWDTVSNVNDYYVYAYSNNFGEYVFTVSNSSNSFAFADYIKNDGSLNINDEVFMFRVGMKNAAGKTVFSAPVYYNTNQNYTTYTTKYYNFKGQVFDHYITNQSELNNIVYYAFVHKLDSLDIRISDEFSTSLTNNYNGTENWGHLKQAVNTASVSFTETSDFKINITNIVSNDYFPRTFTLKFTYNGNKQPTYTTSKVRTQNLYDTPYYEKVNYTKRPASYNNFESDNKLMVTYVETAEELYYAVESKTTPLFRSTTGKASTIYNKAKKVLRSIISDDMTDYEKVLSIFDYISYNSVYDDLVLKVNGNVNSKTNYTSYYLEGVLEDGLAVCDGFSKTFSLLCNMEGIDAVRIAGSTTNGLHAWNKVKLDNKWYVVDLTWSALKTEKTTFEAGSYAYNFNAKEFLSYNYFLVSDAEIAQTHTVANSQFNNNHAAPESYNYYKNSQYSVDEDLVISSITEFEKLVRFMVKNNYLTLEVAFDSNFISTNQNEHKAQFESAKTQVIGLAGINGAGILAIGGTQKQIDTNVNATIYSLTLYNVPKA